MNKIKYVIAILLLSVATTGYSQIKDKEEILKKVFETLKTNDEAGFVKLFPDVATMRSLMSSISLNDTTSDTKRMSDLFETMTDSIFQKQFTRTFKRAMKKAADHGVDWSAAKWESFTADIDSINDERMKTVSLKGNIFFKVGSKDYAISYDDVVWFENRGWYGISVRNIDEKGKQDGRGTDLGFDEADHDVIMDSAMAAQDTMMFSDSTAIAVDEMPKAKPKAPVKKKPVQKKVQAPARKPS